LWRPSYVTCTHKALHAALVRWNSRWISYYPAGEAETKLERTCFREPILPCRAAITAPRTSLLQSTGEEINRVVST
ncbi:hypothetical protein PanWU01x14_284210, partial [Parasponia andersonii]